jgi:hypothetical protein
MDECCEWCGEPLDDGESAEFVNYQDWPTTKVGHDGCQPAGWRMA